MLVASVVTMARALAWGGGVAASVPYKRHLWVKASESGAHRCVSVSTSSGDATYLDIFREFSHMASHDPEKLKRRSVHFRHSFR